MNSAQLRIDKILVAWYLENKRALPWRRAKDPYRVWLSEIILQQTQVIQGLPYYEKFVEHFPTVHHLAQASEQEVLKLWQGLGYYSRARNLHQTAKVVSTKFKGIFPDTFEQLLALKGIGVYTASAIASICFDRPKAVVDGNVYRVLSRVYGIELPINETAGIKRFQELADEQLGLDDPGTYNQAIMEFGALQCVPKNPNCMQCPLSAQCVAFSTGAVSRLPVSVKKVKVKTEYYHFLVLQDPSGGFWMQQRPANGIWPNLFEFPLIESAGPMTPAQIQEQGNAISAGVKNAIKNLTRVNEVPWVHRLTHKKLMIVFWRGLLQNPLPKSYRPEDIAAMPVPAVLERFISEERPFGR